MNNEEIENAIKTIERDIRQFEKLLIEQPNSPVRERIKSEISAYENAVKALEKQLTNGWIPISYGILPNPSDLEHIDHLCTVKIPSKNKRGYIFLEKVCRYNGDHWICQGEEYDVVAYQQLPEPYKEVSE